MIRYLIFLSLIHIIKTLQFFKKYIKSGKSDLAEVSKNLYFFYTRKESFAEISKTLAKYKSENSFVWTITIIM